MIDAGDIVLRRRGESGPNINNNPFPEHKGTVGAITTEEQFEEPGQYIVDENEVIGIVEKPFVLEEGMSKNNGEPFILDLPEPVVLEFPEQSPVHNLQEVPWDYSEPALLIGDVEAPREEEVSVAKLGKIVEENLMPSKPSVIAKENFGFS